MPQTLDAMLPYIPSSLARALLADPTLAPVVYHPLGLVDADGNTLEVATHPRGLRWHQLPEVEAALGTGPAS